MLGDACSLWLILTMLNNNVKVTEAHSNPSTRKLSRMKCFVFMTNASL